MNLKFLQARDLHPLDSTSARALERESKSEATSHPETTHFRMSRSSPPKSSQPPKTSRAPNRFQAASVAVSATWCPPGRPKLEANAFFSPKPRASEDLWSVFRRAWRSTRRGSRCLQRGTGTGRSKNAMRSFSESLTLSPFSRDDSETFSLCCWLLWMAGLEPNSV